MRAGGPSAFSGSARAVMPSPSMPNAFISSGVSLEPASAAGGADVLPQVLFTALQLVGGTLFGHQAIVALGTRQAAANRLLVHAGCLSGLRAGLTCLAERNGSRQKQGCKHRE